MEREIGRFRAQDDDGQTFTVVHIQEFVDASDQNGRRWIPGLSRYVLDDGSVLNRIDAETFKIVTTDQIIRKV